RRPGGRGVDPSETVERMRALYEYRKRRLAARGGKIEDEGCEDRSLAYQQMVQLVFGAQREARRSSGMRRDGKLSNEAMNRIPRELDLEESRVGIGLAARQRQASVDPNQKGAEVASGRDSGRRFGNRRSRRADLDFRGRS